MKSLKKFQTDQISEEIGLEIIEISKSFTGVKAVDNVSIAVKKGTIHALIGENGAGKSTLMNCLYGILEQDSGTFKIDGAEAKISNVQDAIDRGISMIHQELFYLPDRSVTENIFLGKTLRKGLFIDENRMNEDTKKILEEIGFDSINPKSLAKDLSVSELQGMEIAKAVYSDAKIIIMDEPTSSLTQHEIAKLFNILKRLRSQGKIVIYISHKLEGLFEISDEITVLRDGKFISTNITKNVTQSSLIRDMVGRDLTELFPPKEKEYIHSDEILLEVRNFSAIDGAFENISFDLKKGEILGICGLVGSKRTELVESIYGLRNISQGEIVLSGNTIENRTPNEAIKNGFALVTENRAVNGIVSDLSVEDNIFLYSYYDFKKHIFIDFDKVRDGSNQVVDSLNIKLPSLETAIKNLSGGNQQKALIGRWILNSPKVFILDEPTRGVDVGSKVEIYKIIRKLTKTGNSVIMVSSELNEILGMSDRIIVMCDGKKRATLDASSTSQVEIMEYATQF